MKTTKTLIRGLAIDVLVVETMQTDAAGMLFYIAEIHVRSGRLAPRNLSGGLVSPVRDRSLPAPSSSLVSAL